MMKERELMEKNEKHNIQRLETNENLKRILKKKNIQSIKIMEKLEEKSKRIEEVKYEDKIK